MSMSQNEKKIIFLSGSGFWHQSFDRHFRRQAVNFRDKDRDCHQYFAMSESEESGSEEPMETKVEWIIDLFDLIFYAIHD